MDYTGLACEFLVNAQALYKTKLYKGILDATHGEAFVLQIAALRGGGVLPGEIVCETGVSSPCVTSALNRLENKGLITRRINKSNQRQRIVKITRKGLDLANEQHKAVTERAAQMLELLGEQDAKEYVRILNRLAVATHEWCRP